MSKLMLGILLGLILHKTANYVYDYSFNKEFDVTCGNIIVGDGQNTLSTRFDCTYKSMGAMNMLRYVLMRPNATNAIDYPETKWTF